MKSRPSQICSAYEYYTEDRQLKLEVQGFEYNFVEFLLQINLVFFSSFQIDL